MTRFQVRTAIVVVLGLLASASAQAPAAQVLSPVPGQLSGHSGVAYSIVKTDKGAVVGQVNMNGLSVSYNGATQATVEVPLRDDVPDDPTPSLVYLPITRPSASYCRDECPAGWIRCARGCALRSEICWHAERDLAPFPPVVLQGKPLDDLYGGGRSTQAQDACRAGQVGCAAVITGEAFVERVRMTRPSASPPLDVFEAARRFRQEGYDSEGVFVVASHYDYRCEPGSAPLVKALQQKLANDVIALQKRQAEHALLAQRRFAIGMDPRKAAPGELRALDEKLHVASADIKWFQGVVAETEKELAAAKVSR